MLPKTGLELVLLPAISQARSVAQVQDLLTLALHPLSPSSSPMCPFYRWRHLHGQV